MYILLHSQLGSGTSVFARYPTSQGRHFTSGILAHACYPGIRRSHARSLCIGACDQNSKDRLCCTGRDSNTHDLPQVLSTRILPHILLYFYFRIHVVHEAELDRQDAVHILLHKHAQFRNRGLWQVDYIIRT